MGLPRSETHVLRFVKQPIVAVFKHFRKSWILYCSYYGLGSDRILFLVGFIRSTLWMMWFHLSLSFLTSQLWQWHSQQRASIIWDIRFWETNVWQTLSESGVHFKPTKINVSQKSKRINNFKDVFHINQFHELIKRISNKKLKKLKWINSSC